MDFSMKVCPSEYRCDFFVLITIKIIFNNSENV